MKHLGQRYVRYVNRAYRPQRHAVGRDASAPVSAQSGRPTCWPATATSNSTRCVPAWWRIRAECRWSSYRSNAEGKASGLITPHSGIPAAGRRIRPERRAAYRGAASRANWIRRWSGRSASATNGGYASGRQALLGSRSRRRWRRRVTRGKAGRPPAATDAVPEEQADLIA
ncbi:MAG: hypothetical protein MZV65_47840 [Chromatiales bacterium]|nr:hypothetical protein [Chromatiales bacterium]